jgi:hypothetical protein
MMEHKLFGPIELTDAELDGVSGGASGHNFVGIKQSNRGGNFIVSGGGGGGANAFTSSNTNSQTNTNSGSVGSSGSTG